MLYLFLLQGLFFLPSRYEGIGLPMIEAMICGSLNFNNELKDLLIEKGFQEGATNKPNTFVLEKSFCFPSLHFPTSEELRSSSEAST